MKSISTILLCLLAFFAKAQNDKLVIGTDTLSCTIISIHGRGVSFERDGSTRLAALEVVEAMSYQGVWHTKSDVRMMAVTSLEGQAEVEPIVTKAPDYMEGTVAWHLNSSGQMLQGSALLFVLGIVGPLVLYNSQPEIAIVVGIVCGGGALAALINAGTELREGAAVSHAQQ